jgi:HEAT repeat protein
MAYLPSLKEAAYGKDWKLVDSIISKNMIAKDPEYWKWAYKDGIGDSNENIRDLAVSIIEVSEIPKEEFPEMRESLYQLMYNDRSGFVRYRAAFALANHGAGLYTEDVISMLQNAEIAEDSVVRKSAKRYLTKLGKSPK